MSRKAIKENPTITKSKAAPLIIESTSTIAYLSNRFRAGLPVVLYAYRAA
jgi:hypothetical protein